MAGRGSGIGSSGGQLGLGAVGGARGVGAGALSVLLNFVVNYQRGNIEQIARDLKGIQSAQILNAQRLAAHTEKQVRFDAAINDLTKARTRLLFANTTTAREFLNLQDKLVVSHKTGVDLTKEEHARRRALIGELTKTGTIRQGEIGLLNTELNLIRQQAAAEAGVADAKQRELSLSEQQLAVERQLQSARQQAVDATNRISSLLTGLVGGAIGGAIIGGLVLTPLQEAMTNITEGFQRMIDPAKAAAEAAGDVADEVERIASDENLSGLEAAARYLERIGAPQQFAGAVGGAPGLQAAQEIADKQLQIIDFVAGEEELREKVGRQLVFQQGLMDLIANRGDEINRNLPVQNKELAAAYIHTKGISEAFSSLFGLPTLAEIVGEGVTEQAAQDAYDMAAASEDAAEADRRAAQALRDAADAAAELANELQVAAVSAVFDANIAGIRSSLETTIAGISGTAEANINHITRHYEEANEAISQAAENRIDRLQDRLGDLELRPSARTKSLENQLEALKDAEPSKRTRELAAAIEEFNRAQERAEFRSRLAENAEERHQILLRQRLLYTRQQIDLDKFQGADRLIALDALKERQDRANAALDRHNKLLEIQFKLGQTVRRQQGETIQEFIDRRTQQYRDLLNEAASVQRDAKADELDAERDRVQASLDLRENEAKRREIIEDRARKKYLESLQEQLRASQERDRKELESRRESLQRQLEHSRKVDQDRLESAREALQDEIEAVRENAQQRIEQNNAYRERIVNNIQQVRDADIAAARAAAEKAIEAEEERKDAILRLADQTEAQRLVLALYGARNIAELQAFAGRLAGARYALEYLVQTGQFMGLDPATQQRLISNYGYAAGAYLQRMNQLVSQMGRDRAAGLQHGGMFMLNNANTPLRGNIRWGDGQGDEIGVVLSNKVTQALREQGGVGGRQLMGDVYFQAHDPYRDRRNLERLAIDAQRRQFN